MSAFWRDIAETYVHPGRVMRRKAAAGLSERQLLGYLMGALFIAFLVRLPVVIPLSYGPMMDGAPPEALIGSYFVAVLFFAPLFMYLVAMLSHLIAHMVGGKGDGQRARLALFWSLLALQPLMIVTTTLGNLAPLGRFGALAGIFGAAWSLWIWLAGLSALERDAGVKRP